MQSSAWSKAQACVCGRVLLAVHFLAELLDKLQHFSYWVEVCRKDGQPYPVAEMMLVVLLLLFGAPCLLFGAKIKEACVALIVFQIPTTIFFEDTHYTKLDSVSVIGGLVLAYALAEEAKVEGDFWSGGRGATVLGRPLGATSCNPKTDDSFEEALRRG